MDFLIRQATDNDYGGLCEVFEEGDAFHREALPRVFREPDGPARTRGYVSSIIADDSACLFVAEHGSQIIGLVLTFVREAADIPIMASRRYAVIDNLVVKTKFRRFGVGQALLDRAHRWVSRRGVTDVELNVWEFNKGAIAFYEKMGYATASRKMWKSLS